MNEKELFLEVEGLAKSDAPDAEVVEGVVGLVHEAHSGWDWSGIYLMVGGALVIGPFVGSEEPPEHSRIEVGDGVCGAAVAEGRNQIVRDVRERENYLACSLKTRSELVVLIHHDGDIVGQFDIDSDSVGAFSSRDERLLEAVAGCISPRVASLAATRGATATLP